MEWESIHLSSITTNPLSGFSAWNALQWVLPQARDWCKGQTKCLHADSGSVRRSAKADGYLLGMPIQAERNYETTHHVCLALKHAILLWRAYLEWQRFSVRTDHDPFKYILDLAIRQNAWSRGDALNWRFASISCTEEEPKPRCWRSIAIWNKRGSKIPRLEKIFQS